MSEKKGLLLAGHVSNLERAGVELSENSEKGLQAALEKNAAAIFNVLLDELRNTPTGSTVDGAEMYHNDNPQSDEAKRYRQMAVDSLAKAKQWVDITERFFALTQEESEARTKLQKMVETYKTKIPSWEQRVNALLS